MRLKPFLLAILTAVLPLIAQATTVTGVVVNSQTGSPVQGATVVLRTAGIATTTGFNGDFRLEVPAGNDYLVVDLEGYTSLGLDVKIVEGANDLGHLRMVPNLTSDDYYGDSQDLVFDEALLEDEDDNTQGIAALTGAQDNIYYNTASYNFGPMYFRYRGYDSQYQAVYINGVQMNDLIRGGFSFSQLGGMTSRAFRNSTATVGLGGAAYGFGDIAGVRSVVWCGHILLFLSVF